MIAQILTRDIARLDALLTRQVNAILHHPAFQKLEASWRGLRYLVEQVPEGEYELTVWMPSWHVARVDHDPGTNLATVVWFHPPLEVRRKVTVRRGEAARVDVAVSEANFRPR